MKGQTQTSPGVEPVTTVSTMVFGVCRMSLKKRQWTPGLTFTPSADAGERTVLCPQDVDTCCVPRASWAWPLCTNHTSVASEGETDPKWRWFCSLVQSADRILQSPVALTWRQRRSSGRDMELSPTSQSQCVLSPQTWRKGKEVTNVFNVNESITCFILTFKIWSYKVNVTICFRPTWAQTIRQETHF